MNITFLVGNGFDIAAGANTSYRGFYEWYCEQPDERLHIQKFKEAIQQDIANGGENWSDFEIGLGQYTDQFTSENIGEFWDCYDDAQEKMVYYLKQEEDKLQLENFNEKGIKRLRDGFLHFFKELSPLECKYFEQMINSDKNNNTTISFLSFNYTSLLDACLQECTKTSLYAWNTPAGPRTIAINPHVIHLHGTTKQYPILGVNDISQIKNQELLLTPRFTDSMVKPVNVESIGYLWHNEAREQIKDSQIICIFGSSLGETDLCWWKLILDRLIQNRSCRLIIFCYRPNALDTISSRKRVVAIDAMKSKFTSWLEPTEAEEVKKDIFKRIHVVFNSESVFQISLLPEKDELDKDLGSSR